MVGHAGTACVLAVSGLETPKLVGDSEGLDVHLVLVRRKIDAMSLNKL